MRGARLLAAGFLLASTFAASAGAVPDVFVDPVTNITISGTDGFQTIHARFEDGTPAETPPGGVTRTASFVSSPGQLHGEASAAIGSLKGSVEIQGKPARSGLASIWTSDAITLSGGAPGTPGSFGISFLATGSAVVKDDNGFAIFDSQWIQVTLSVRRNYDPFAPSPFDTLYEQSFQLADGGALLVPVNVQVPFLYDETFSLYTLLRISLLTDNQFTGFSGGLSHYDYGPTRIDRIGADFFQSFDVTGVTLAAGDALAAASGVDYTALPEPGRWLLLAPLVALARASRRPREPSPGGEDEKGEEDPAKSRTISFLG